MFLEKQSSDIQQYDICFEIQNHKFLTKFMDVKDIDLLDKFGRRTEWISVKEFPTLREVYFFIEKFYNKPNGWIGNVYIPTAITACDKICKLYCGKPFAQAWSQKDVQDVGVRIIFWLLFLSKELNYPRLPEVYCSFDGKCASPKTSV